MTRPRPWVIVPGIWNSDPEHWQSRWQADRGGAASRIEPSSWTHPDQEDWSAAISRTVGAAPEPPVLIAHSLGVLAATAWLADHDAGAVAGAFLVAPPDPASSSFPDEATGFRVPSVRLRTPSTLVVSDDDPYCAAARATAMADAIGAATVRVGPLGHVNVASGVGDWPAGRALLDAFIESLS